MSLIDALQRIVRTYGEEPSALARGLSEEVTRRLPMGATWCLPGVQVTKRDDGGIDVELVATH
jgi:hypothetical protein